MNGYQGQILAFNRPDKIFKKNEELFTIIKQQSCIPIDYIQSIGIQAKDGTELFLNNQLVQIGQYEVLQLNNVKITSIKFNQDTDSSTKIDYIIHQK